jgi:quinone-modifying oxidoreductase subunit QmoC
MTDIHPDKSFIEALKAGSGSALSTCMQCGACTAACGLSGAGELFPRKEMAWASWGLKEQLMRDTDIWLCHQCGDCTSTCPRGVRPGDVLAALRKQAMLYYARPAFLARMVDKPAFLPVLLAMPVLVISIILLLAGTLAVPEGPVDYSEFFPHTLLNISFTALLLFGVISIVFSLRDFWRSLAPASELQQRKHGILKSLLRILPAVLLHKKFSECRAQKHRYWSHLLVFWGFVLLLAVTFCAILATIFFEYPLGFWHPVKIAGNLAGMFLVSGTILMIIKRIVQQDQMKSTYADWLFLIALLLLGISGFLIEAARFGNWPLAYHMYFTHLVLVWLVILYLPYTHFAHFLYRITALVKSESAREI